MAVARRLRSFGETVFAEFTRLAIEHDAINLGQGYPNFDGPDFVKEAAVKAITDGHNQYARSSGLPELTEAIARRFTADSGIPIDPAAHVTVTSGCTEALAATCLGLLEPAYEVVVIEPFYDAYPADLALAGAIPRHVTLRPPDFRLDPAELRAAMSARTRALILNTPHNPSGRVFSIEELDEIAALCREYDVTVIADEVYEHMVYDGTHVSIASREGMWERTITLSSLGKTFSLTGWKIGWAIGPEPLTAAVRAGHQFLTYATATPLQWGAVAALGAPEDYYRDLEATYRARRDLLATGLTEIGFEVFVPEGTYFMLADHSAFGFPDDVSFVRHMIEKAGVAAIPSSAFYRRRSDAASLVRFAFCKDEATLTEAVERLAVLRG